MLTAAEKQKKIEWCLERHRSTNHFYDKYIPYEMHLRIVVNVFRDFKHLLPKFLYVDVDGNDITYEVVELACWGHDLIEDTRTSYNDVKAVLGKDAADIIYAVSNEKGRNRAERGSDKYYEGIRSLLGAIFAKLCDRIGNIQYSELTKSDMFGMYFKENEHFMERVDSKKFPEMEQYLINLFKRES